MLNALEISSFNYSKITHILIVRHTIFFNKNNEGTNNGKSVRFKQVSIER